MKFVLMYFNRELSDESKIIFLFVKVFLVLKQVQIMAQRCA